MFFSFYCASSQFSLCTLFGWKRLDKTSSFLLERDVNGTEISCADNVSKRRRKSDINGQEIAATQITFQKTQSSFVPLLRSLCPINKWIQIVSIASMRCGSMLDVRNQKSELLLHYVEGDLIKIFKTLKHKNSPFHQYFFRLNVPLSIFNENPSDFSDLL